MKIVIFGAAGVIGQHMRLCVPAGVEPIWMRRTADRLHRGLDLTDARACSAFLQAEQPVAIVNLAGESRPDVVERDSEMYRTVNGEMPGYLARWCRENSAHLVQVSTQAVFSGRNPPYGPRSVCNPANLYGCQKYQAEFSLAGVDGGWTIVRPTFVLGVRPMPHVGRANPIEQMLSPGLQRQVSDHWFSVSFAEDVARELWTIAMRPPAREIIQLGSGRLSRFAVAAMVSPEVEAVSHGDFPGIAPRPVDTTYEGTDDRAGLVRGILRCRNAFESREWLGPLQRAKEISLFTGRPVQECLHRLNGGFDLLHPAVALDFHTANPQTDAELLEWYRRTEAYVWELSAYHADAGFNYAGMCQGVAVRLKNAGAKRVLCLGDGIGDLTLALCRAGFDAVYHDLTDSRTAAFAELRLWMYLDKFPGLITTTGWSPAALYAAGKFDAVASFDFLEHVTDVPAWTAAIRGALKPGGLFFAQNAFACGSGPNGSIPMHLDRNDHFEKDWEPHLASIGFEQQSPNWYRRAA